ncbi:helix-turn-helix transcriptional regulator [Saccharopolyspora sp. WRP15-2]|uniref:Helix-turn-helix transcriptional regulator n=1 Tax=Saccharopolyspora oryzae TaxID=2997343 RepID=A0ABT4V2S2_9PSEU|nr:helix-turn-helix transcriptional regulator [Saccharopolyspora oryzae]MDA3628264.1 helix-turn-helix transcriptional regulator [Saccharopolyspora oryzae]
MARTPRGRALGNALREARQEHGLTVRGFATQLGRDPGVLSRWETGDRIPKPEQVAQILTALGVNGQRFEEVIDLAYGASDSSWVATTLPENRQQLAALLDLEQGATNITEVSPLLVPGLLQTTDYIRGIMGSGLPAGELATRVSIRIGRREVLTGHKPTQFTGMIGQSALTQVIGSPDVLTDQLRHLLEIGRRPNIELRIIRSDSGWNPALDGPFMLIEGPSGVAVHLENRKSGLFLHEEADIRMYRQAIEMVRTATLSPEDSAKLIADLVDRMERKA